MDDGGGGSAAQLAIDDTSIKDRAPLLTTGEAPAPA